MEKVVEFTGEEWGEHNARNAYLLSFAENRPGHLDRTDFALLFVKNEVPVIYMSCHEMDAESAYIQFGGSLNPDLKPSFAFRGYMALLSKILEKYKQVTTTIENTNTAMLRPAMKAGFQIVGVKMIKSKIYLDHVIERGGLNG